MANRERAIQPSESKSRLQYGVGSVLLGMTGCCVFLGLESWSTGLGFVLWACAIGISAGRSRLSDRTHGLLLGMTGGAILSLFFAPSVATSHWVSGVHVSVFVMDRANGEPVAGARVRPAPLDDADAGASGTATTGEKAAITAADGTATAIVRCFLHRRTEVSPLGSKQIDTVRPLRALAVEAPGYETSHVPLSDYFQGRSAASSEAGPALVLSRTRTALDP
jgi:hypothetical protein